MKKQNKGISLIVLVITIIVILILASAVINSLSNSSIITKAKEAKKLVIKDGYTYVKSSALKEQEKNSIEELELGTQII